MELTTQSIDAPFVMKNGMVVKNRLLKSSMLENFCDTSLNPTDNMLELYRAWSRGGVGMSISGNIMINRSLIRNNRSIVLDEKSALYSFRRWAVAGTENKAILWAKLNHPMIQTPYKNRNRKTFDRARAQQESGGLATLRDREIMDIISKFAISARLAKEVGFSGVQLDGSPGYLVHQFLSSSDNFRKDIWGGSLENRMRFLQDVYWEIRKSVGQDFPICLKISVAHLATHAQAKVEVKRMLECLGKSDIDMIEVCQEGEFSFGETLSDPNSEECYINDIISWIKTLFDVPVVVTGRFRSAQCINHILKSGIVDFVGLSRPFANDPALPSKLISNDTYQILINHMSTGSRRVDKKLSMDIFWHEYQLLNIARGKVSAIDVNVLNSSFKAILNYISWVFAKRR